MNIFKHLHLTLFATIFVTNINAQTNLYFSLRMNNPAIRDQSKTGMETTSLPIGLGYNQIITDYVKNENYSSKFGFAFSIGVQHSVSDKVRLGFGLDFTQTNFNRMDKVVVAQAMDLPPEYQIGDPVSNFYGYSYQGVWQMDNTIVSGAQPGDARYNLVPITPGTSLSASVTPNGNANIYYMNIPFTLNYFLGNKLSVGIGVSASIILASNQHLAGYDFTNPTTSNTNSIVLNRWTLPNPTVDLPRTNYISLQQVEKEVTSGAGLNRALFFGTLGASYNIVRSIWLDFNYKHSFSPIYEKSRQVAGRARFNFFEFGLKYDIMFWNKVTKN